MSEFLNSVKADLLDRRLLPFVALVGVLLIAAIAYAVLGKGSSASPSPAALPATASSAPAGGISVSSATEEKSVAETTDGTTEQRKGHARNPFEAIAGTTTTAGTTSTSSSSSGSSSTSSSTSESGSSTSPTGTTPAPASKHEGKATKPGSKKKTVYHVAIEFGVFPAGASVETVVLTPYENLKLSTPLPSAKQPLLAYRGVTAGGKSATFTIVGEAILHGIGNCLPSATQCEAVDLKPGQSEQLEYLPAGGETVTYELRVVSIAASQESASAAAASLKRQSKAGAEILRKAGLTALPVLHYSQPGVLVFPSRRAFTARAHTAVIPHGLSH